MKNIFIALLCMVWVASCSNDNFDTFEDVTLENQGSDYTPLVRFNIHSADGVSVDTKGYDANLSDYEESAISNYNIYCFNTKSGREIHQYVTSNRSVDLLLDQGEWEIFVVANTNSDLGTKTIESLKTYSVNYINAGSLLNDKSRLHMSYHDTIEITEDATIEIKLKRLYAKVNVNVNLSGVASGYKIISREVKRAPMVGYLFKDNISTFTGIFFKPDEKFSFYMFENLQGVNADITSAKSKIAANAPTYATYIVVTAQSSNKEIKYTYYLGENVINDFNIKRNHTYNINMNISGNSSSDMRVETTTIPTVEPELTYSISGDYSRQPHLYSSWFEKFDSANTFTFKFESGNDQAIDIELLTDLNNVNSDSQPEYFVLLMTESIYDKFTDGIYDNNDIWEPSLNLLQGRYNEVAIGSCYTSGANDPANWQRHTYATVKPNTTYRMVLQRYYAFDDDPPKKHDMKLYMNRGTSNERSVNLNFYTTAEYR